MVIKIEVIEKIGAMYSSELSLDFLDNKVSYTKGNVEIANRTSKINQGEIDELLKGYITYWKNVYIDNSIIDGRTIEIVIYTDKDVITYYFKNEFPDDLEDFIRALKRTVDIDE